MQIPRPHPSPLEPGTQRRGPAIRMLGSPPGDSDVNTGLDLSAPRPRVSDVSEPHPHLGAQGVSIHMYFRNTVCFHFNKGSRLEQYSTGCDSDLIKMPSSSGPREGFLEIPSAILRAAAAETQLDGAPRSHLCTRRVRASCPTPPGLTDTPGKIKSLSWALNLTAAISCKPQLPPKGRCRHLDQMAASPLSNVTSDVLLS